MSELKRIIWAADPLEEKSIRVRGIHVLRDLAKKTRARVEPVYLLSDGLLSLSVPREQLIAKFKPGAEKALKSLVKEARVPGIGSPHVLVAAPTSRGSAVEALDRYARKRKADLIYVTSHGRHGISRALLGSFAETLMLHAKTPVLISGPHTDRMAKLKHIVFPTDFSAPSKKAFEKVLGLAKQLKARLTILHVMVNPVEPFVQSGVALLGGGFVTTQAYVDQDEGRQRSVAARWSAEASKKGVKTELELVIGTPSVIKSILEYSARRKPDLIAMASESGAFSAALLGSLGRGVARDAPCPVWFLRR